ncbi:hypothetical protein B484DRAFT_441768 [Ochromonadaceae sp. CCMP2298]|nr:hypothetical protein B484DRAFT_441768 [Ochromonadaceae sp. CCMP2298]
MGGGAGAGVGGSGGGLGSDTDTDTDTDGDREPQTQGNMGNMGDMGNRGGQGTQGTQGAKGEQGTSPTLRLRLHHLRHLTVQGREDVYPFLLQAMGGAGGGDTGGDAGLGVGRAGAAGTGVGLVGVGACFLTSLCLQDGGITYPKVRRLLKTRAAVGVGDGNGGDKKAKAHAQKKTQKLRIQQQHQQLFNLRSRDNNHIVKPPQPLRCLALLNCRQVPGDRLPRLLPLCPHLHSLQLSRTALSAQVLQAIRRTLPLLHTLEFSSCTVGVGALVQFIRSFKTTHTATVRTDTVRTVRTNLVRTVDNTQGQGQGRGQGCLRSLTLIRNNLTGSMGDMGDVGGMGMGTEGGMGMNGGMGMDGGMGDGLVGTGVGGTGMGHMDSITLSIAHSLPSLAHLTLTPCEGESLTPPVLDVLLSHCPHLCPHPPNQSLFLAEHSKLPL